MTLVRSWAAHDHTTTTPSRPPAVPLAVWPVAQTSAQYQRAGRYLPACTAAPGEDAPRARPAHRHRVLDPGQVVVDPLAGIGTTLVEAALLDRRAIGIEVEARWVAGPRKPRPHAR